MKVRRISMIIALVFLTIFSIAAFSIQAEAAYKIGVIISTTGKYGSLGQDEKDAMLLLVDKINKSGGIRGNKLDLIIEDDETNAAKAGSLARKLITEENVVAIIGSTGAECSHIVAIECEKRKIPMVYFVPTISVMEGKRWVFNVTPSAEIDTRATYRAITKVLKKKKVGILYDSNEYGTELKNLMVKVGKEKGDIEVVAAETYQKGDSDLKPHLIKIKNKGADVLYLAGTVPTPAIAVRNFRELGMDVPIVGCGGIVNTGFIKLGKEAVEGVYGIARLNYGDPLPEEKELFEAIRAKFNVVPSSFHANGWQALQIVARAMSVAGDDPNGIRDALENTKGFKGVIGEYNMTPKDHNGLNEECLSIVRIQNGVWNTVK